MKLMLGFVFVFFAISGMEAAPSPPRIVGKNRNIQSVTIDGTQTFPSVGG